MSSEKVYYTFNHEEIPQDLGIEILTGESCAYGMRLLCDLNAQGVQLIRNFFGAEPTAKNWNSSVNQQPAVASIMLPREAFLPLWMHTMRARGARIHNDGDFTMAFINFGDEDIKELLGKPLAEPKGITLRENFEGKFANETGIYIDSDLIPDRQKCHVYTQGETTLNSFFGGLQPIEEGVYYLPTACLSKILAYSLLQNGARKVAILKQDQPQPAAFVINDEAHLVEIETRSGGKIAATYAPLHGQPIRNGRCVHQMSGRAT